MTGEPHDTRFVVPAPGGRVDRVVADFLGLGRRDVKHLLDIGCVRVDGRRSDAGTFVAAGAVIDVERTDTPRAESEPAVAIGERPGREEPRVVWRNAGLVAVYKPAGFHSVRGLGRPSIADFVAERFPETLGIGRSEVDSGLVHRLDRDTSGLMLVATDQATYDSLKAAFAAGALLKEYLALVAGVVSAPRTIEIPLARRRSHVRPARRGEIGREAVTTVTPLEIGAYWTLVSAAMRTGVTHQIRAHLALVGHAVIGDVKYGAASSRLRAHGHLLHARRITFDSGVSLAVDPGVVFLETLASLRNDEPE